ncbi:MAG: thiamine phosphate synthase [Thermoanaerobaculia bacterium]
MTQVAALRPGRIYAIADAEALAPRGLAESACIMAEAGIETIQLRAKLLEDSVFFAEAERCLRMLEDWPGTLWIDDRVDLALLLPFAGVHLGKADLPPAVARRLLPSSVRIAVSTHDEDQLAEADQLDAAAWIALGPIFATRSKRDPDPVVGLDRLRALRGRTSKPLIAIGGVQCADVAAVLAAGADSVAVISAVCAGDIARNCRELLAAAA